MVQAMETTFVTAMQTNGTSNEQIYNEVLVETASHLAKFIETGAQLDW